MTNLLDGPDPESQREKLFGWDDFSWKRPTRSSIGPPVEAEHIAPLTEANLTEPTEYA